MKRFIQYSNVGLSNKWISNTAVKSFNVSFSSLLSHKILPINFDYQNAKIPQWKQLFEFFK